VVWTCAVPGRLQLIGMVSGNSSWVFVTRVGPDDDDDDVNYSLQHCCFHVRQLKTLGFTEAQCVQAYFACDKTEEFAANFLLSQSEEPEDMQQD